MKVLNRWATLFALLVIASLLLAACATPTPEVLEKVVEKIVTQVVKETVKETVVIEGTPQVVEKEVTKVVEKVVTPTPTAVPQGGFVVEVSFADAKILNPILSSDDASSDVHELLFGAALQNDPFSGALIPDLVEGWDVSTDGLTYTFHVHDGVYWSDGTQVTGKDFAFTYRALKYGELDSPRLSNVEYVEEINLIDDMTVEFVFSEVNCTALPDLGLGWLPAHMYAEDFSDIQENDLNTHPTVVNGPLLFQEWVKDDHITLVRNPNYWRGAPYLDGWIYKVVPNATVGVQQLKTGEVDVYDGIEPKYLVEMELQEHLSLFKYFDDGYTFLAFQMGDPNDPQPRLNDDGTVNENHGLHPILSDVRVRYAVTYATDRNAIISRVKFGQAAPLEADVLPGIEWAYNADLERREYDLEKAAALLEEAGWTDQDGDGVRECHGCLYTTEGTPLKLKIITNAGNETRENIGLILQDQLGEIGFDIEFEAMEWNAFVGTLLGQTFDMCIVGWTNMGTDPDDESTFASQNDLPTAAFNFNSYYNPQVDALLKQAKTVPGCRVEDRGPLYRQVQELIYQDAPYTFLYVPRDILVYNSRIGGMNPGPWEFRYNIHEWYIR
ncbi:MAG: ABC transporter substrate-binding protein [Chloroflexota bacterium]